MNRVKICGITSSSDASQAAYQGAWALGFIFNKKSKRDIGAFKAKKIISELPPFVTPVGVFVNQKEGAVRQIAEFCGLRALQFHGEETPAYCKRFSEYRVIKAFRIKDELNLNLIRDYKPVVSAFLFDTFVDGEHGGTGKTFDWNLVKPAKDFGKPIIISGHGNGETLCRRYF
jgi:phosphoribosylanthranilate isomerase